MSQKLAARGFHADSVGTVLAALATEGLQSDERFAENYVQHRIERGYGPARIRRELHERGIADAAIEAVLAAADADWQANLEELRRRKFGRSIPTDYREQARQSRFLYSRGFDAEQIRRLFRTHK